MRETIREQIQPQQIVDEMLGDNYAERHMAWRETLSASGQALCADQDELNARICARLGVAYMVYPDGSTRNPATGEITTTVDEAEAAAQAPRLGQLILSHA